MNQSDTNNLQNNDWDLEGEDQLSPVSSPLSKQEKVSIEKGQYSVYELLRQVNCNRIILAPSFQRNDVWGIKQKSELIESIILGIPLPLIYLFEDENGYRQVIDGKQRITALKTFFGDELKLKNLTVLTELNNKTFSELSGMQQGMLEDHQLLCYILKPPTPERIKFDIYDRVNRGGTQLNKQEIRFALYQGQSTDALARVANSDAFTKATGSAINSQRMKDQYAILKCWSFYFSEPSQYKGDVDQLLSNTMRHINQLPQDDLDLLEQDTIHALKDLATYCGPDIFRFTSQNQKKRPINIALMETLVFFALQFDLSALGLTQDDIQRPIFDLRDQLDNQDLCGKNQNNVNVFYQRQQTAEDAITQFNRA